MNTATTTQTIERTAADVARFQADMKRIMTTQTKVETRPRPITEAERLVAKLAIDREQLLAALQEITERYSLLDARLVSGQHSEANGTISRARQAIADATKGGMK